MLATKKQPPPFSYTELFQLNSSPDTTEYRKLEGSENLVQHKKLGDHSFLEVQPQALSDLADQAMRDIAHLLRPAHLQQLSNILDDEESSANDRFVALELLKNANVAAGMILPGCQDTGTGIAIGKRGQFVLTDGNDEEHISRGIRDAYCNSNLRYSQVAPQSMFEELNTGCNLPAQIDLYATKGNEYSFLFMAKGGGSANKTFLHQKTKALLNEDSMLEFLDGAIKSLGTAACPPYHLALVIGGLSAELNLKTVKLASAKYLDNIPKSGSSGGQAFRDLEWEDRILELTRDLGIGAQFGGKYFCHDVRVIRLPRHGASCPVGIGVSCSADRQAKAKITDEGIFLEKLETDPGKYLPEVSETSLDSTSEVVNIDLSIGMDELRKTLSRYPIRTRVSLTGELVVARDIAHAKLKERINRGEGLPDYIKNMIIYYAGPAKTPNGYASGSFGPTTAGRMDSYVGEFQKHGGSFVTLAKGNRSKQVTKACHEHGGFYLGSIGGPAAILAKNCIKNVEVLEYPELGMEAIWKIKVENFPAFIVVDDKGNDFFKQWQV